MAPDTAAGRGSLERALIESGHDPDEVRTFVAEAHARADEATTTAATMRHPWQPPHSAGSDLCGAMVMRDGGGDECGLPRNHPTHQEGAQ